MSSDDDDYDYDDYSEEEGDGGDSYDGGKEEEGKTGTEAPPAAGPPPLMRGRSAGDPYFVCTEDQVADRINALVADVAEIGGLSLSEAVAILRHAGWQRDRAVLLYTDALSSGTVNELRRTAGLWDVDDDGEAEAAPAAAAAGGSGSGGAGGGDAAGVATAGGVGGAGGAEEFECPVCGDDEVDVDERHQLPCGHTFCNLCMQDYVNTEVSTRKRQSWFTTCPEVGCEMLLTDREFDKFCSAENRAAVQKYKVLRAALEMPHIKACINGDCDKFVEWSGGARTIACTCGARYCWSCERAAHRPATCDTMTRWEAKEREWGGSKKGEDWIAINTRACPSCKKRIYRSDGCNHMTCSCGHEFCWMCKADWKTHGGSTGGYYSCNIFEDAAKRGGTGLKDKDSLALLSARERAQERERFNRFDDQRANALNGAQVARTTGVEETRALCDEMLRRVTEHVAGLESRVRVLDEALDTVAECRELLAYSYVLGYTEMPRMSAKDAATFSFEQPQLERFTDLLQETVMQQLRTLLGKSNVARSDAPDAVKKGPKGEAGAKGGAGDGGGAEDATAAEEPIEARAVIDYLKTVQTRNQAVRQFERGLADCLENLESTM